MLYIFIFRNIKNFNICFQELCKLGYAYHSGKMVSENTPANNASECLNQCDISPDCKFWDFGDNHCRLRSNNGNGPEVAESYTSGQKYCLLGMILSYNI